MRLLQRPADSLVELKQELAVFSGADSHAELVATYRELSQTQVALGELRGAFERHSEFKTISQRLLQRQLDQCFATLKVSFDGETRDKQNRLVVGERDASARALGQAREVGRLRMAVNMLAGALTLVLVLVTIRMRWATATMRALAIADQLTGLRNRRAVLARLRALFERPNASNCAVIFADLDHLKPIDDCHGHAAGDEVLRAAGPVLTKAVREPVFVGRLGGRGVSGHAARKRPRVGTLGDRTYTRADQRDRHQRLIQRGHDDGQLWRDDIERQWRNRPPDAASR